MLNTLYATIRPAFLSLRAWLAGIETYCRAQPRIPRWPITRPGGLQLFNIGVQVGGRYILVVLSGEAGTAEIQAMNVFVADLLSRTGRKRVLLDSLAFSTASPQGADDAGKRAVIAHMAATMPQLERVAVLVPGDSQRGFVRGAAAARHFEAQEFTDIVEAEAWLQRGD